MGFPLRVKAFGQFPQSLKKKNSDFLLFASQMPKILRNTTSLPSQDGCDNQSVLLSVLESAVLGKPWVERASWTGCKGRKGLNRYVSVPHRNASTELAIELERLQNCWVIFRYLFLDFFVVHFLWKLM